MSRPDDVVKRDRMLNTGTRQFRISGRSHELLQRVAVAEGRTMVQQMDRILWEWCKITGFAVPPELEPPHMIEVERARRTRE